MNESRIRIETFTHHHPECTDLRFMRDIENVTERLVEQNYFPLHSFCLDRSVYIIFYQKPERP